MEKKLKIFEENLKNEKILVDFEASTFVVYEHHVAKSGYWKMTENGEIKISPLGSKKAKLRIRGVVLRGEGEQQSIVLLKSGRESNFAVTFSSDGEKVNINFENKTFSILDEKGLIQEDGCWEISGNGSVVLDPLIGGEQRKKKKTFEIEGLILQNKEDGENLIFLKKK